MNVIYPGSFDPPTNGHLDIILRCSKLFKNVIVAVLKNTSKQTMFSIEEMLDELSKNLKNVEIKSFSGLLVDFCEELNIYTIIRGLRDVIDFNYEFKIFLANSLMNNKIETLFIPTKQQNICISSSIVKEIAILNGEYSSMVPEIVKQKLKNKLNLER